MEVLFAEETHEAGHTIHPNSDINNTDSLGNVPTY